MSPRVRALPAGFVLAALCGFCVTIALGAVHDSADDAGSSPDLAVVYGDLEGLSNDSGLTDEADQEDAESSVEAREFPAFAASSDDHAPPPERVRPLRPDRPPQLAHLG